MFGMEHPGLGRGNLVEKPFGQRALFNFEWNAEHLLNMVPGFTHGAWDANHGKGLIRLDALFHGPIDGEKHRAEHFMSLHHLIQCALHRHGIKGPLELKE